MPRGVYERNKGEPMTAEELAQAEQRMQEVKSPIKETDFAEPTSRVMKTDDGRVIKQFGNFQQPAKVGHQGTLKQFNRITHDYVGWVEMTPEQALEHQKNGLLVGYDHDKGLGLIKKRSGYEKATVSSGAVIE